MNPLLKTRSDYRDLKVAEPAHRYFSFRLLIPVVCVLFGFVLGLMFNKREGNFKRQIIAMSEPYAPHQSTIPSKPPFYKMSQNA